MSERDPRVDPKRGDVLMSSDISGTFTVLYRGRTRVSWQTAPGCEYGENLSWFRDMFKHATIIKRGDQP